jgi:hypothetical protein
MRPSFDALPPWLSGLSEVPPTPVRAGVPQEEGLLQRTLRSSRLPLHVALLAIVFGVIAATAAGSVRARDAAASHAEMSAFAQRKVSELTTFTTLRAPRSKHLVTPLPIGGSLIDDVPGYSDVVEGTEGRRFRRRWVIEEGRGGDRKVSVRIIPQTRAAGRDSLDVTGTLAAH